MSSLETTSGPAIEPITTAEAKSHLRVLHSSEDTLIAGLVQEAREWFESYTWRRLVDRTMVYRLDGFPRWRGGRANLEIPAGPLKSVTSIQYVDTAGDTQTLAASKYDVDTKSLPPRIQPAWGETWPDTRPIVNAVTITMEVGYGTSDSSPADTSVIPAGMKEAIKLYLASRYDIRGDIIVGTIVATAPRHAEWLAGRYRLPVAGL